MARECVICGETQSEETQLLELPCFNHWVCKDISSYFEQATENESLYPPQCCDEPVPLDKYAEYIPEDVQVAFQVKEQGEYTILPKYRVYCASASCGKFLHPDGHITDVGSNLAYAVCDGCFQATCVSCKLLLADGLQGHKCAIPDHDLKFKETVEEQGYKECSNCGVTVELTEACNHITCKCGNDFCYICGKQWPGMHGCPQYGHAVYDAEGYNQDGFHRDSGLNRGGRTRREEIMIGHDDDDEDGEHEDEEDGEHERGNDIEDFWIQVLHHIQPDRRAFVQGLPADLRGEAMDQLVIELMDQGVTFNVTLVPPPHPPQPQPADESEESEGEEDNDGNGGEGVDGADNRSEDHEAEPERNPADWNDTPQQPLWDDREPQWAVLNTPPGAEMPAAEEEDLPEGSDTGSDIPIASGVASLNTGSSDELPGTS